MELLTFVTAGSVDDGKSTLIGRLLHDTGSIPDDQIEAVARSSARMGFDETNLALLTDGLRAEREQGITIDVAHRYFSTPRRSFIIADAPGHEQYTRNMVCGASVSDLGLLLVDARTGLTEQTRRHAFLLSLLGVPHLLVAVNKMDLVGHSRETFEEVAAEVSEFMTRMRVPDLTFIPISALNGDNVVSPSERMDWYGGGTVLHHLETVHIRSDRNLVDARFPVQYVLRPRSDEHHDYRAYAGQVAGGVFRPGDEVMVLPSGMTSAVASVDGPDGPLEQAFAPMSVALRLTDDLDVSRGDLICRPGNRPEPLQDIDAMICWMDGSRVAPRAKLRLKHTGRDVRAQLSEIVYRVDVNTLHRAEAGSLGANDIARVRLRTAQPIMCDDYARNRTTGSFILIDPDTKRTVAGGMVNPSRR
ncbi:sulfate adenylyltransferase [Actinomadura graeca]|uniref:sulfate adenylyltransferase n=1 Tax=Actinomadura graeca TaxID=2750812 RepID=A0ABX8QVI6_9ACTN|nr:GTP-binding protein [Actinomadura graeca]QXJ22391.1 sulfate adenylyltransferase [Actinomadura graeca]